MAYTIIVGDDNSLYGSQKEKILQKEKLFNKIWFLVKPHYNGYDMSQCTVTMRYLLPLSKEFVTETLTLSEEDYKGYLKYILPIDTNLSKEWGDIELNLTFTMVDVDDNGNIIQRVRKTTNHNIHITQLPDWDAFVPDSALSAIDQRIIAQDAQIKRMETMNQIIMDTKADNIKYNENTNELQLLSGGNEIGDKVKLKTGAESLEDGVPVIDLNSVPINPSTPSDKEDDDSVVEF